MEEQIEIVHRIRKLRELLTIHSYIYYTLGTSVVSDDRWQEWAEELRVLQEKHPYSIGEYDDEFHRWDGSTGMHLSKDSWVVHQAHRLVRFHEEYSPKT